MTNKITMIDSGAFSLWQSEQQGIDVRRYGDYLLRQHGRYEHCVNLDVIPGKPMYRPSEEEAKTAVEKSWVHQKYLESLGVTPLPIFHQREDDDALRRIIDANYEYLGFSPDDRASEPEREAFLDHAFYMITDDKGWPIVKVHGFGVTSIKFMLRYPWYSLDSTTWKYMARNGNILVPSAGADGGVDYTRDPIRLAISEKSPRQFSLGNGIFLANDHAWTWLIEFLEAEGFSVKELASATAGYAARCRLNVRIMQRIADELPVNPYQGNSFFVDKFQTNGGIRMDPRKLIFATEPSSAENRWLTSEGISSRLLSYDKLRKKADDYLDRYMSGR